MADASGSHVSAEVLNRTREFPAPDASATKRLENKSERREFQIHDSTVLG